MDFKRLTVLFPELYWSDSAVVFAVFRALSNRRNLERRAESSPQKRGDSLHSLHKLSAHFIRTIGAFSLRPGLHSSYD